MPRLPIPGQDIDQWGTLLNEFLQVAHRADGSLRSALQPFSVRNYGATGDGVTNDSAAIDAAQQAARGTGGAIYFPTGVYLIARNVQMTSPLHFEHGARIRPESGVTLLMDEEREASENDIPLQPAGIIAPEHAMIFDLCFTYDGYPVRGRKGPNLTDDSESLVTVADGCWYYLPSGTLTANRTLKLSRDGAVVGNIISIVRADVSPHTFAVVDDGPGGETLQVLPGAQPSEARFRFNGSTWGLQEYGEL